MLALGIIAPVFPKLVIQLEGGNEAGAAGAVGLFGTVWAAMQFVFAPVLGALSDRVGRRPVILVSCLGLGLDHVAHDALPSLFVLYGDYRFGWTARTVGFALAGVGVVSMIVQGGLVGAAVKRLGESRALVTGLAFGAVAFTVYGLAPSGALFLLGFPVGGLFGLTYPDLQG